jgi:hypothetical protein
VSLEFLIKVLIKRNFTLLLKALGKERSPMFPKTGPLWKQTPISRALVSISFRVPIKGALPMKCEENIQSPSTEPHVDRRPTYNGVRPGFPRGLLATLLSLLQCHAALGMIPSTLAWVDQSPVSQHVIITFNRVMLSTPVTASHVTQGKVEYEST